MKRSVRSAGSARPARPAGRRRRAASAPSGTSGRGHAASRAPGRHPARCAAAMRGMPWASRLTATGAARPGRRRVAVGAGQAPPDARRRGRPAASSARAQQPEADPGRPAQAAAGRGGGRRAGRTARGRGHAPIWRQSAGAVHARAGVPRRFHRPAATRTRGRSRPGEGAIPPPWTRGALETGGRCAKRRTSALPPPASPWVRPCGARRGRGGIGRHAGFRFQWRKPWGFKSLRPHHRAGRDGWPRRDMFWEGSDDDAGDRGRERRAEAGLYRPGPGGRYRGRADAPAGRAGPRPAPARLPPRQDPGDGGASSATARR